jgi:CheY-like chemotaxis protein
MASILVVDDESDMCVLLQAILEAAGHRVVSTTDSRNVSPLLEQQAFDVVISDVVMPRRDGIDVVRDLRRDFPAVGIIAMSGANPLRRELYFEAGKQVGADATFGKPFSKEEILASIAAALEKASLRKKSNLAGHADKQA